MTTFTFHTDPGHGWLEVPIPTLIKVGLAPSDFSSYSFQQGHTVYLEEDCDATVFLSTYERVIGPFTLQEKHSDYDSWVRRLPRIAQVFDDLDF